ncbi:MAG: Gx transporter family protein [Gammaproteobacteria bacterium]|nr:Gx transporter family protein [Gammaproteobacteria bacterium]MDH5802108.1 Gx transporter family protein [Gammaproteobacteria bacterium]
MAQLHSTREDHLVAWLTALAISIHVAESALPSPIPGIKPGLANIVTLVALLLYGWRTAVWVSLLRVLLGSIVIGTFLSPTFVLSFSGAICSVTVLTLASMVAAKLGTWRIGALGYGVLAAMSHMIGQFYAAYYLFVPHQALLGLLPFLMTAAMGFGIISGLIALKIVRQLGKV